VFSSTLPLAAAASASPPPMTTLPIGCCGDRSTRIQLYPP
jgi:hypothetical protein